MSEPLHALNPLVRDVGSPPIPEAQEWLDRYDGAHGPPIMLSQAAPGDPPPQALLTRLAEAAARPELSRYGPIAGDPPLREAYSAQVRAIYGSDVAAGEIMITAGCNQAYTIMAMTLARAGDNLILPTPWYFNHEMTLSMLGVEPRALPCRADRGFVPDPVEAERLIDARTRAIVLVTPNNPTGAVYPAVVIEAFSDLCRRRGIRLILDETYRDFLPPGLNRPHGVLAQPDWRGHVIQLYSFSKAYAVPGWRLGAVAADAAVLKEMEKVADCVQICATRAGQAAVAWGIDTMDGFREANRAELNRRADAFRETIGETPGWRIDSIGAYFAYVAHPFAGRHATEVAERLASERGVLALPGPYFGPGQEGHLRFAVANVGVERIAEAGRRLQGFTL
jgi:aspartate/methionine/tyrosine aminotransferase